MARTSSLILLTNSLTKAEKRYFKLITGLQNGDKNYLSLFELIAKSTYQKSSDLKKEFKALHPNSSFEITAKYLYTMLMESLLHLKSSEQDDVIKMHNALSVIKILFDKSLYLEGFNELQKLQKLALKKGDYIVQLISYKVELFYRNQLNFLDMSEKELVQNQMKISSLIRLINNRHQHVSLYEMLRHRLIYKGNARTVKQKEDLNDLVVSEMNLMNIPSHNTFETTKTHLLFQSSYCISVGDYKSALKTFYELNQLFENNKQSWEDMGLDYLTCIEGILDSLHTIKNYKEIDFFINKISCFEPVSAFLNVLKHRITFLYKMISLMDQGLYAEALESINTDLEESLLKQIHVLGFNKQAELYLYIALIYFGNNQMQNALKYLNKVLMDNNMYYKLPQYKTFKLIRLLVHYELANHEFVKYEITSFKRQMHNKDKTYKLEKLIFYFIQNTSQYLNSKKRNELWEKLRPDFEKLRTDKYEIQILKIFDFATWVEAQLCRKPFLDLLKQKNNMNKLVDETGDNRNNL